MELITSFYFPPKSTSHGHAPRSKDLTVLAGQVEAVLKLIIPQIQFCNFYIVPSVATAPTFHLWRHRLAQASPRMVIPQSMDDLSRGIECRPEEFGDHVRRLQELAPLPEPSTLFLQFTLCVSFCWRGAVCALNPGYQRFPTGVGRENWSAIHFILGNRPHVFTHFVLPVRHDVEEGRRLVQAFNNTGLVRLSDKHFRLMRYNPKSKKWSPTRTA